MIASSDTHEQQQSFRDHRPKYPPRYPTDPADGAPDLADFELFTKGQPYEGYRYLRERAPVAWCEEPGTGPGFWSVSRYADVITVENDPRTYSSQMGGINIATGNELQIEPAPPVQRLFTATVHNMICLDGLMHRNLRMEHMPFFNARFVEALRQKVRKKVSLLLDRIAELKECDLVANLSAELPLFTLSEILGIPEADRPRLVDWMHYLEMAQAITTRQSLGITDLSAEELRLMEKFPAKMDEAFRYGLDMLYDRRLHPQEDLLSAIAQATLEDEPLSDEFLDGSWLLILFAGNDTTRNSISGTMNLLTRFPKQKKRLLDDASLLKNGMQEAIRMVSPVIYMRRTATRDAILNDQQIAAGEKVVMWYGSANRDESIFPDADLYDVSRPNAARHLAFGRGPHVCLGKSVALMQLEETYGQILQRFPEMAATAEPRIAPSNFVHAIQSLPVSITGG